mgnify:CR=1 FL=1
MKLLIMMKKLITLILASFVLGACASAPYPAIGAEKPNILIIGEDHSDGTFPRNSRVFLAVLSELTSQLNEAGFDVYDETAVTLDNFVQGRTNRPDAEVIGIAQSIDRVPIDVVVVFHLYGQRRVFDYIAKVKPRILARALNVNTGQVLANVNRSIPETNMPSNCRKLGPFLQLP